MMSVVSNAANGNDGPKKRVQIVTDDSPTYVLDTPNPKLLFTPLVSDLPTTAELMQRCLAVNPFEAKFREANQRINNGAPMHTTASMASTLEAMEANGLVPMGSLPTSANMTDLLLKLPTSTLQHSPGIFSNISILAAANDNDATTHENLKTADISKLLSAVSAAGDSAGQAPRTADVLNAVLDMHSDRLHTINYINKPDFSAFMSTPSSSAPNSASILGAAMCASSTSGGLLAPPPKPSPAHSPRDAAEARAAAAAAQQQHQQQQRSPADSDISSISQSSVAAAAAQMMSNKMLGLASSIRSGMTATSTSAAGGSSATTTTSSTAATNDWDPRDVKPPISKASDMNYFNDMGMGSSSSLMQLDDLKDRGPKTISSGSEDRELTPTSNGPTPSRGRGRGRSTTADMPPDERRLTILERNKAAAVRYRKRKKEEHDDMIGRVHGLEQEKNTLATQNQVLRRELERVTALLHEREARCVCLKGMPLSSDLRSDSPVDILAASRGGGGGMYVADSQQLMLNGLALHNGMQIKRPKM